MLRRLKRPTRNFNEPDRPVPPRDHAVPLQKEGRPNKVGNPAADAFLFGLASDGVYLAGSVTRPAGELLPHRFTLTGPLNMSTGLGGLLSVALSLVLRPVGVTHHRVLRSPDFPPGQSVALSTRLSARPSRPPCSAQRNLCPEQGDLCPEDKTEGCESVKHDTAFLNSFNTRRQKPRRHPMA